MLCNLMGFLLCIERVKLHLFLGLKSSNYGRKYYPFNLSVMNGLVLWLFLLQIIGIDSGFGIVRVG